MLKISACVVALFAAGLISLACSSSGPKVGGGGAGAGSVANGGQAGSGAAGGAGGIAGSGGSGGAVATSGADASAASGSDAAACSSLFHACAKDADCCAPNRCLNITGTLACQLEGPAVGGSTATGGNGGTGGTGGASSSNSGVDAAADAPGDAVSAGGVISSSGGRGGAGGAGAAGGASDNTGSGGAAGKGGAGGAGGNAGSGGAAGNGGAAGAGGVGGHGGAVITDACAGGACGRPARTYTFTRTDVRPLTVGSLNAGLVLAGSSATPTLIYLGGAPSQSRIWAAHLPVTGDAGVSVSLAYQISRGELGGGAVGTPQVRTAQNGDVRLAYMEQYNGLYTVRYVTWNGDFSQTPTDVTVGSYNLFTRSRFGFGLDPQDRPAFVYFQTDDTVVFAENAGSGWQMTTLATQTIEVLAAALAFDGNGVPSVFWLSDALNGQPSGFVVANPGSAGWSAALLDPQVPGGDALVAGRDGRGQVEIFYHNYPTYYRAIGTAGAWTLGASVPQPSVNNGQPYAVAFGAGGEVHVAYDDNITGVMYGYFDGCSWSTQVVDSDTTVGDQIQIAVDSSGVPHISYQSKSINAAAGELWYASPAP
jgi:hypothetical protein